MTLASDLARGPAAGAAPHALARYRSEFPIFGGRVYLNTCSLGALGERSRRKVAEFLDLWQSRGASAWYDVWWEALAAIARAQVAQRFPPHVIPRRGAAALPQVEEFRYLAAGSLAQRPERAGVEVDARLKDG